MSRVKKKEFVKGDTIAVKVVETNDKKLDLAALSKNSEIGETDDYFTHKKPHWQKGRYSDGSTQFEQDLLTSSTELEIVEAEFEAKDYMYKILSYAKEDNLTPEELKKAKLFHYFSTKGVKNGYAAQSTRKLLSADIFYILLSEIPVVRLAEIFDVSIGTISKIKHGTESHYAYEHTLVQSIRSIVSKNLRRLKPDGGSKVKKSIFRLVRMSEAGDTYEILYYCKSRQVACGIRRTIIKDLEFKRLTKKGLLDIKFPIQEIELL